MLDYFRAKNRRRSTAKSPVLNEEDEQFFGKLAEEGTPPPLPVRPGSSLENAEAKQASKGKDAQVALMDGADQIPLPASPEPKVSGNDPQVALLNGAEQIPLPLSPQAAQDKKTVERQTEQAVDAAAAAELENLEEAEEDVDEKETPQDKSKENKGKGKRGILSYFPSTKRRNSKPVKEKSPSRKKKSKSPKRKKSSSAEYQREEDDLTAVLDQLNLSAVNNRAFSFSKESQELFEKFTLVLKDLIHGAPYAYHDLEKLLTESEGQLNRMFDSMPPFLQNLVKSLPSKVTASLAPELLAAGAEKASEETDSHIEEMEASSSSKKFKIPDLKKLVASQSTVVTMLRSILNFLRMRFPTFVTGTNVLMSLAVFILLFVFWYLHKRGKEERLKKTGAQADDAASDISAQAADIGDSASAAKPAQSTKQETTDAPEPPIVFNNEAAGQSQKASVDDMPSVLHLPEPASVPLPASPNELPQ